MNIQTEDNFLSRTSEILDLNRKEEIHREESKGKVDGLLGRR